MVKIFIAIFCFLLLALSVQSQPGSLDFTFNSDTGLNGPAFALAIQSDCKILVGGGFNSYNGVGKYRLFRITGDGMIDNTFRSEVSYTYALAMQQDEKIIVGCDGSIQRLNADGTRDATFDYGGVKSQLFPYEQAGRVNAITLQPDGKIIFGGGFSFYNDIHCSKCIARVNMDGTLDQSFNPGTGFNYYVASLLLQEDGKILMGGAFTTFNGTECKYIAKLNTDGSFDTTFSSNNLFNGIVNTLSTQDDGKIIVGGGFDISYNGKSYKKIIRLNPNGSIDTTFNVGTGFDDNVNSILILSSSKMLVGGKFHSFNGTTQIGISQLNISEQGIVSIDTGFYSGAGFTYVGGGASEIGVNKFAIQPIDKKIVVGGHFNYYNGYPKNGIIRLISNESNNELNESCIENIFSLFPIPASDFINIESTIYGSNSKVTIINTMGQKVCQSLIDTNRLSLDINLINSGVYYLIITDDYGNPYSRKFIVVK